MATDNEESAADDTKKEPEFAENETPRTVRRHSMIAYLYKLHISEDIEVLLNPENLEVLGEATPKLKALLRHTSMKELIDLELFKFDVAVDIIVDTEVVDGPPPEKESEEPPTKKKPTANIQTYKHPESGECVQVTAARKILVGEISEKLRFELNFGADEKCLKKYIENGNLVLAEPTNVEPSKKTRKPNTRKAKTRRIRLYRHKTDPTIEVVLAADSMKNLNRGRQSEALKSALNGKSVEQCVEDGDFEFIGEYDSGVSRPKPNGDYVSKTFQVVKGEVGDCGGVRHVDVAAQRDRVVYRFKNSTDSPLHEMFIADSLNALIDSGKLVEDASGQRPQNEDELLNMLVFEASHADIVEHGVRDEKEAKVRVNLGNGEISDGDRAQFELGNKTYGELLKTGVLLPEYTKLQKRPHIDKQMLQLLKCKKVDSIEFEGDIATSKYVMWVTESKRKDVFVVKDEAVAHESLEEEFESDVSPQKKSEKAPAKRKRSASVLAAEDSEPERKIVVKAPKKVEPLPQPPPKNLDDEFDEEEEPGFVSELSSSEVDSDDVEDNDDSDRDISGVENRDDSEDSDYYGTAKDKAEAKRKKMRLSRAERSAKRARIAAEAGKEKLGEVLPSILKMMRKRQAGHTGEQRLIFDPSDSEIKNEVKNISLDAAIPIFLGLHIIEEAPGEEESEGATFYWNGVNYESITERLVSILSEDGNTEEKDEGDEKAKSWSLCKKALGVLLRLGAGQAIHTAELVSQIGGDEASDSQEKVDIYDKTSTGLRVLLVRSITSIYFIAVQ